MSQATYEKLCAMRLSGMAEAYTDILNDPKMHGCSFSELMGFLTEREWARRKSSRLQRLIKNAQFDQPQAHIADIDYSPRRELSRDQIMHLADGHYIQDARNIVLLGATGTGKSFLACALGVEACKQSYTVRFTRMTELLEEIRLAQIERTTAKCWKELVKVDLLIVDDWMLIKIDAEEARILFELIHRRHRRKSTILCSQFAPPGWHKRIPEETLADAILDRIVYDSHQIHLKTSEDEPSMRKKYAPTS